MVATGLMIFLLKLGSRRQWNEERGRDQFDLNVSSFFHSQRIAHGDSLNYFLQSLETKHLHTVRLKLIRELRRKKVLDQFRLSAGYLLLVVDGTGMMHFGSRHCQDCWSQRLTNGEWVYSHPVLEAKIVCANGLVVSIGSELLRNEEGADRQDCELKAFYRLAPRIKRDCPQLRLCLVADGLYAGEPTFRLCEAFGWAYLIVLRDDDLPTVWEQVNGLRPWMRLNRRTRQTRLPTGISVKERAWWTSDVDYHGQPVQVLEYEETIEGDEPRRWAWITNLEIAWETCLELAQAGRRRWKIENEGFNTQKNGGYGLEHIWSITLQAQENFYLLMQIAHLLSQLVEKSDLLMKALAHRGLSLKAQTRDLLSEMKKVALPWEDWRTELDRRFQIRFNTS
jgi:hypothetical protein